MRALVEAAYGVYVERIGRRPAPMDADYERLIGSGQITLAELAGVPAGLIVLVEHRDHLLVENVAVAPAHQGRGVGRRLMGLAEDRARAAGLAELRLYTNLLMTENLAWYPSLGYQETGRRDEAGFARVYFRKRLPNA